MKFAQLPWPPHLNKRAVGHRSAPPPPPAPPRPRIARRPEWASVSTPGCRCGVTNKRCQTQLRSPSPFGAARNGISAHEQQLAIHGICRLDLGTTPKIFPGVPWPLRTVRAAPHAPSTCAAKDPVRHCIAIERLKSLKAVRIAPKFAGPAQGYVSSTPSHHVDGQFPGLYSCASTRRLASNDSLASLVVRCKMHRDRFGRPALRWPRSP